MLSNVFDFVQFRHIVWKDLRLMYLSLVDKLKIWGRFVNENFPFFYVSNLIKKLQFCLQQQEEIL